MRKIVRIVAAVSVAASVIYTPAPGRAAFPGANGPIAFQAGNTRFGIYTMSPDGSGQVALTTGRFDTEPEWSADGSRIVFESEGDIYVINADGTGRANLTNTPTIDDGSPSWSPDGTRIAFASVRQNSDIYVMDANGDNQTALTTDSRYDDFPEWSPDGLTIAFFAARAGERGVFTMPADTGEPETFIALVSTNSVPRLDWSPDSSHIAYVTDLDLWTVNRDGTGPVQLTVDGTVSSNGVAWSPDGTQIAYASQRSGDWDIYVTSATRQDTNGTFSVNVTNTRGNDFFPDWGVARPVPGCDPEQPGTTCGTQGNDNIEVTVASDANNLVVQTGGGDDTVTLEIQDPTTEATVLIDSGAGADTITLPNSAGRTQVEVRSGDGDDVIRATAPAPTSARRLAQSSFLGYLLRAGRGKDRIVAGTSLDTIDGGGGADDVNGAGGADKVGGGGGNDKLEGGAGSDDLLGGGGKDVLHGSGGANDFAGGSGTDTCLSDGRRDRFKSCERIRRNHRRNHQQV